MIVKKQLLVILLLIFGAQIMFSENTMNSPQINIAFPVNNEIVPREFTMRYAVENFNIPADGKVRVTMRKDDFPEDIVFDINFVNPYIHFTSSVGELEIELELLDPSGNPLNPVEKVIFTLQVQDIIEVNDISELRSSTQDLFFELKNDVEIIFKDVDKREMYMSDLTGGIIIKDPFELIDNLLAIDSTKDITGKLVEENGLLKIILYRAYGSVSGPISFINQTISYHELLTNFNQYESQLVTLGAGEFLSISNGQVFTENTAYTITDGATNIPFVTKFSNLDYIGTEIPVMLDQISGIVSENNGSVEFTSRSLSDIVPFTLSTNQNNRSDFKIYPNPNNGSSLTIQSSSNSKIEMKVFNVLGKEIFKASSNNGVFDMLELSSGVYFIKIIQDNKEATKKLVVRK